MGKTHMLIPEGWRQGNRGDFFSSSHFQPLNYAFVPSPLEQDHPSQPKAGEMEKRRRSMAPSSHQRPAPPCTEQAEPEGTYLVTRSRSAV